jgi:hypothetical protein
MQRYKKIAVILLKILILVFTFGYIYNALSNDDALFKFSKLFELVSTKGFNLSIFLILLFAIANQIVEAFKWKYATRSIEKVSLSNALASVFSGISIGIFTPNNIGEYGGKILYLKDHNRGAGLVINFITSISQLIITLTIGLLSFLFYFSKYITAAPIVSNILTYIIVVFICLMIHLFINLNRLSFYAERINILTKLKKYTRVFDLFHSKQIAIILLFAFFRYVIFSTQYLLIINYVDPSLSISNIIMMTSLIFLAQSILPSFAITELMMRGSLAAFFFEHISTDVLPIVASAFSIWILNVILPAIIGSYFVLKANFLGARN